MPELDSGPRIWSGASLPGMTNLEMPIIQILRFKAVKTEKQWLGTGGRKGGGISSDLGGVSSDLGGVSSDLELGIESH